MDIDPYKILFYAVLGAVVVIVSIVRFIGWRKEKRAEQENKNNIKA
jgi:Flp pilus assembly protein TadB